MFFKKKTFAKKCRIKNDVSYIAARLKTPKVN